MQVAFVGNCQAGALTELFGQFVRPWTGDEARFFPIYGTRTEADLAFIAEADILVDQVFEAEQAFAATEAKPRGSIVRFPHVAAPFLYPYRLLPHPRDATHPALTDGPYPEGCRYLRELMEKGGDSEQVVATWLAADLGELVPLDRVYKHGMATQHRRDAATGFRCAEIIADRLRAEWCFRSVNHPTGPVMLHVADETFRRMDVDGRLIARMRRLLRHWPVSIYKEPVHPSVARHFALPYVTPDTRYSWAGEGRFTIAEWARRYLAYEWNPPLHEGR